MREILVVPGTNTLLPTLSQMRRERAHMALVIDEYGGTNGVVTMEDLLEELVGDIEDEYDPATAPGAPASDTAELDGLLHRDDVQELTGLNLPEGPYETLAGFLMTKLGQVPHLGDELDALGYHFQVTEMDGRRPSRIRVEAQPEDSPTTPDDPQSADTVL
jgi:putative hemolysin